jgi:hypothetical protein
MEESVAVQETDKDESIEQKSRDAYDRAWMNLKRLKGLVVSANLLNEANDESYADEDIGFALGLVEEWITGILEDMDEIIPAQNDLLTRCERRLELLARGAFIPEATFDKSNELIREIDGFITNDLPRLTEIKNELAGIAKEAHRTALCNKKGTVNEKAA